MFKYNIVLAVSLALFMMPANAAEKPKSLKKQTVAENYLSAKEAHNLKKQHGSKLLFVDVRTPSELVFVGSPKNMDSNIPFLTLDYQQWDEEKSSYKKIPNNQFETAFNKAISNKKLSKDSPIILLCRSGKRSAMAANLLTTAGYTKVYTVIDGFEGDKAKQGVKKGKRVINGWKNAGLPWSYKLERNRLGI